MDAPLCLSFESASAPLADAGGKGANLARLARAGFPVPPGFILTTAAYRQFVAAHGLAEKIAARLKTLRADEPAALEAASAEIRGWFTAGALPDDIAAAVTAAYAGLGAGPVAVRSSATAEDLPDLSFAGQQDTYLNVLGVEAVQRAVVACWASLWTARAIGYRARNQLLAAEVALAVVVQAQIASEASGVLFTADPLTGLRTRTVIDATLGLGEALVSGQVEPDHYEVETETGLIVSKKLGAKALVIRGRPEGGVVTAAASAAAQQALSDDQITALTALGRRVQAEYGAPQDIEWAWAGGQLYLLQARPITSLFPLPAGAAPDPLEVFFSFGAVQGLLDPITPLGQDALFRVIAGAAQVVGYSVTAETQDVFYPAGERIWVAFTPVVRNGLGRRLASGALSVIEPSVRQALLTLFDDPRLAPTGHGPAPRTALQVLPRLLGVFSLALRYLLDPDGRRESAIRATDAYLEELAARLRAAPDLAGRVAVFAELTNAFPMGIPYLATGLMAGMASFNGLRHLSRQVLDQAQAERLVLETMRGLPHNVTTAMDLRLWETARALKAAPAEAEHFLNTPAADLAARYLAQDLPPATQRAVAAFLDHYGARGLGEIDFGRRRWREDPAPVMQALQSYLRIDDAQRAPDVVFARGAAAAEAALAQLVDAARRTPGGWLTARVLGGLGRRMRAVLGLRESPKFFIIRMMGLLRAGLLESAQPLVQAGVLERADDLAWLHLNELEALARGAARDWRGLVRERRAVFEREQRRRQVPRVLLSDGRTIYEGLSAPASAGANVIHGDPVSPGAVEGAVRVVLDPAGAQLLPGEILVCPGTDPSWTPLFLAAGGLITEVGGLMTHGSVVAREYGIPAVVGVDRATQRLKTGQRIRVDGATGQISLLEN